MILILMFLNFRSDARSEIGDPVHAGEEEEEEEEEILGSDDDEQEDPKDYVKGVSFSRRSIPDFFYMTSKSCRFSSKLELIMLNSFYFSFRWLPSCENWRSLPQSISCSAKIRLGTLFYCMAVLGFDVSILAENQVSNKNLT